MTDFICPLCRNSLKLVNKSLLCSNRHCYDLAKEGYVNLLPLNSKKSKNPGDNSKMMSARRAFLEMDHYKPLAEKLTDIISNIADGKRLTILDTGCGEGYYTNHIKDSIKTLNMLGLDISKTAVRYASKKSKDISYCVASAFDYPLDDLSLDIILRVFAPSSSTELHRVLKDGGYFIAVTPGKKHLYQLRDIIYNDVRNNDGGVEKPDGFDLKETIELKYSLSLKDIDTVMLLLHMTPFGWKLGEEEKKYLYSMSSFDIDCDFKIEVFKKIQ